MSNNLIVKTAIVDTMRLTLFLADGTTRTILQGDPRLKVVFDYVTPQILANNEAILPEELLLAGAQSNVYRDFEKKSNKLIRFFKIAKDKLKSLLDSDGKMEATIVGDLPSNTRTMQAVEEVMAHAVSAEDPRFNETTDDKDVTVVGVCGSAVLTEVEQLENHLDHANRHDAEGMQNFLRRAAAVSNERRHSVDDLLRFMKRADAPVTKNGDILIYKVLRRADGELTDQGDYVDCHTHKVPQRVGDKVFMSPSLVDHDRSQECSNGLHVARREYLRCFSGDVCVAGLVAPEDVIAVPAYDSNKMRVCAYTIIHELSNEMYRALIHNRPITDVEGGAELLGKLLADNHTSVLRTVEITEQWGGGIVINELTGKVRTPKATTEAKPAEAIDPDRKTKKMKAPTVNPKEVIKEVKKAKTNSRQEQAQKLHKKIDQAKTPEARAKAIKTLRDFKRKAKVSWGKLGVSEPTE